MQNNKKLVYVNDGDDYENQPFLFIELYLATLTEKKEGSK